MTEWSASEAWHCDGTSVVACVNGKYRRVACDVIGMKTCATNAAMSGKLSAFWTK